MHYRDGINSNNILEIFKKLHEFYVQDGGTEVLSFLIVGGAAVSIGFSYRRSTQDIDAMFDNNEILSKAIEKVALLYHFNKDWLNADFVDSPSYTDKLKAVAVDYDFEFQLFRIKYITDIYLIAMKLKSCRPTSRDLDDIIEMTYEIRLKEKQYTYNDVISAFEFLYGNDMSKVYEYFLKELKRAFELPIEDIKELKKSIFDD